MIDCAVGAPKHVLGACKISCCAYSPVQISAERGLFSRNPFRQKAMYLGRKIGIVVPARNEALLIGKTLNSVPEWVDLVVVVDDGSSDDTGAVVRSCGRRDPRVSLWVHQEPQGVGGAILAGYDRLRTLGADVLVVMAGDAQMDPADLPSLLKPICTGRAEFVKGNRFAHPEVWKQMPKDRYIGNLVLTLCTRFASGYRRLKDAQCGYTAMDARLVPQLRQVWIHPGYGFPNALVAHLGALGVRLAQVPVRPVYATERSGLDARTVLSVYPRVLLNAWRSRLRHQRESSNSSQWELGAPPVQTVLPAQASMTTQKREKPTG
jgi:hypothetical protein